MRTTLTLATLCAASIACAQNFGLAETFGSGGAATFVPGPAENTLNTHHFLSNGRMLVTGTGYNINLNNNHVSMVMLDTVCGALDTTFGNGGMVQHYHEQRTLCRSTALQPDGKIVGCGTIAPSNAGSQQWPAVFRYNADGSVDSTFNGTGYHRMPFITGGPEGDFNQVFVNADGTITCVGASGFGAKLGAYRFTPDGALDATFNGVGYTTVTLPNFCSSGSGSGLLFPDSSILSIVIGYNFIDANIELAKFNSAGEPDSTFGVNGLVVSGIYSSSLHKLGSALQPDGKILVSCFQIGTDNTFLMARFMPDGSVDQSYGSAGVSLVVLPNAKGTGMQLLADGSTLQFGRRDGNGVVLKRDGNGQVDISFGNNGFVDALTTNPQNQVFVDGELLPDGRLFGIGGTGPGETLVVKMTTDPAAYALPVISVSGADLVTTGTADLQWFLNGTPINGANGDTHTPAENGDYTVEMTVSPDCIFTSPVFSLLSVGIADQSSASFRILSNPVAEVLVVLNDGANSPYEVVGMNGKRIASGTLVNGRNAIDLSGVASGVYLLRAMMADGVKAERISKQ